MALVGHGFLQSTRDVDLLVNRAGLEIIHERLVNHGYEIQLGSKKNIIDTAAGVRIDFYVTGAFAGGRPPPMVFPGAGRGVRQN